MSFNPFRVATNPACDLLGAAGALQDDVIGERLEMDSVAP